MNQENSDYLNFNASHIISVELKSEIASNCKLRSKFVHEKLLETKNNLSGNPLLLKLSNKGLRILNPDSEALIMSHSIQHISYTACDRSSCQFALVARSSETGVPNSNSQFCHVLRLCSADEADAINRYIGALFKDLNQKRRTRRSDASTKSQSQPQPVAPVEHSVVTSSVCGNVGLQETGVTRLRRPVNAYDDLDTRLRRISTPHIEELVSEKHLVRRLSLCIPSPGPDEPQPLTHTSASTHSSLDKHQPGLPGTASFLDRPLLRKKSDHRTNKITAVIERLSFRASRDLTAPDMLKSGSPVVALKEQLESWDGTGAGPPSKRTPLVQGPFCSPWKVGGGQSRKNSTPMPLEQNTDAMERAVETPPVPPVRIHSLRNAVPYRPTVPLDDSVHGASTPHMSAFASPAGAMSAAAAAMNHYGSRSNSDDHLSSITTPSSCGNSLTDESRGIDMAALPRSSKAIGNVAGKMNFSASFNDSQYRSFSCHSANVENHNCSLPLNYFRNLSKDDTTEYLIDKEMGSFVLRHSASHQGCFALSVKVSDTSVSHYIIAATGTSSGGGGGSAGPGGYQIKGLDKTWPSLASLVTHLSVIQEILPCPLFIGPHVPPDHRIRQVGPDQPATGVAGTRTQTPLRKPGCLPQSRSAEEEYQHRMRQFLNDTAVMATGSAGMVPVPLTLQSGGGGSNGMPAPHEQYQQLSDFSSIVAGYELN